MNNEKYYISLAKHCIGLDRKKPYVRHEKNFIVHIAISLQLEKIMRIGKQ